MFNVRLRRVFGAFSSLVAACAVVAPGASAATIAPPAPPKPILPGSGAFDPPSTTPIKHVIVVVMENRTFDNMFSGFPGADTVGAGRAHDGSTIPLATVPFVGPCDPDHSHGAWLKEWDGGKMDAFDLVAPGCIGVTEPGTYNYAHLPRAAVQPYWNLASQFALADRMFASQRGPSYPGHLYLVAASSGNQIEDPGATEWGCDAPAGTTVETLDANGNDTTPQFPCLSIPTLGQTLDRYGISWAYYSNNLDYDLTGKKTSLDTNPYDAIDYIRFGPDWATRNRNSVVSEFRDLLEGDLPTVAWFNPPLIASDHAQSSTNFGPEYNAVLADVLMQSKYWNDTALFITWDDAGGWYDHVAPRVLDGNGLGFRVPLIVVSKYAKRGYVSHVQHEYGSIIKFVEENFNLPSLGATDMRADDLHDMFDFSGAAGANLALPPRLIPTSVGLPFFLHLGPDAAPLDDDGAPRSRATAEMERRPGL